jgi:hypothetical protein
MDHAQMAMPTNRAIVEETLLGAQKSSSTGYVAAILPFIVIIFILGFLSTWWSWYPLEYYASRQLTEKYGAYFQEKHNLREERLEAEQTKHQLCEKYLSPPREDSFDEVRLSVAHESRGEAPRGAAWV